MTIEELIAQAESGLTAQFARIDRMEEIGTRRVLDAFREHQVAYRHFAPTTGYGYETWGVIRSKRFCGAVRHAGGDCPPADCQRHARHQPVSVRSGAAGGRHRLCDGDALRHLAGHHRLGRGRRAGRLTAGNGCELPSRGAAWRQNRP